MDTCLCMEVYLILWFWFFSLLVVTGAQLVVRVTTLTIPPLRLGLLILRSRSYNSADIATIRSTFSYQIMLYVRMMCQPIKNKCATENIIIVLGIDCRDQLWCRKKSIVASFRYLFTFIRHKTLTLPFNTSILVSLFHPHLSGG